MSEEKKPETKPRTIEGIHKEYTGLCTKAGHLQYQITTLNKDLSLLNDTMRDLNFEAAGIQAKQAEEEKAKAAEPTTAAVTPAKEEETKNV